MGSPEHLTVDFTTVVSRAVEDSFRSLNQLTEKFTAESPEQPLSDTDKKIELLKFLNKTQQRMLRLNVLAKWCHQVPLIQYCQQINSTFWGHDTCFTEAANSLFHIHEELQQACAPVYDVSSAVEILMSGTYPRLPKCIEDLGAQSSLSEKVQKAALKKLDMLVRRQLLDVSIPKEIKVKVNDGTVLLSVKGEFKVLITLGYRGHLSMWRILHMELLVGDRSGLVKLEAPQRYILGDDLERRMTAVETPFKTLYSVLHEMCVKLVMDTVLRQVHALRQGRWKDTIRFEILSDRSTSHGGTSSSQQSNQDGETETSGLRTPGLKIVYWLYMDKRSGTSDSSLCPSIVIDRGPDLLIRLVHSTFVIDPLTGKEAAFSIDQSCIDVQKLLLRAICCNRYTRLLVIQKELGQSVHISQSSGDVAFQSCAEGVGNDHERKDYESDVREYEGHEVLRVCAYGSSFFSLGINTRNGRFRLQSSRNILASLASLSECEDALNQGTMTAAEVFMSLRTKSILHLYASIGRFLGLEVYEEGLPAVTLPKKLSNGSTLLLMGLPDCGSCYFLRMQLDHDFKPLFELLQTQPNSSEEAESLSDQNHAIGVKKVDVNQMQMQEDDINFILLEWIKLQSILASIDRLASENGTLTDIVPEPASFASMADEVFELVNGFCAPSFSPHIGSSSFNASSASHFGTIPMNPRSLKAGSPASKWEGGMQMSQTNNAVNVSGMTTHYNDSFYSSSNMMGTIQSANGTTVPVGPATGTIKVAGPNSGVTAPASCALDSGVCDANQHRKLRKRTVSEMLNLIPSLQGSEANSEYSKRRKVSEVDQGQHSTSQVLMTTNMTSKSGLYSYGDLISQANKGHALSSVHVSAFLHVVRHRCLDIKHARLISQMEVLDIPYAEEVGFRNTSAHIWFRLPFARNDAWQRLCLRLDRAGSMYWDVKINDQHFRDLWELQKGSNCTPWGSVIRIANASDVDSHIRYEPEGVVLSYHSVEDDSIKKLVADIQRLYNSRMFSVGMRKLVGVRADEKPEESINFDSKEKSSLEGADRFSEQMRKGFRIEAVGLMSLWFSFGSGEVARFVVEWESGKEGCTMHVSPDQIWPHTKFLEDFINGAEVPSLLDCIRLTAGPLHALAAASGLARAGPVQGINGVAILSSVPKQASRIPQGPMQTVSNTNVSQSHIAVGNPVSSAATNHPPNDVLHGAAMLGAAAAAGGGPGIVPSSLLPIDVSVVLRGPYLIRTVYRKHFAVDMQCFAGDQVWLQPATPPKGRPSVGGSLPCPQFQPFIMELVAQELSGLDTNFNGGQLTGLSNVNTQKPSTSLHVSAVNGNGVNVPDSAALSWTGDQVVSLNHPGNASPLSSNTTVDSSGMPLRRSLGAGPAHVRGELNTDIIGLGDDGGYGGGWVPQVALEKVLRGILKYLGVLWLFAQLPDLLKEILGSILKENEGTLLNLDQEQPGLRFFVGGHVFAVSVHRVQLVLQILSVKKFHQQQQQNPTTAREELSSTEIGEICDYFSRRVASEPYDASRVASFITLLTLPISVLREFLKIIAWKKGQSQPVQGGGDLSAVQKPRIELCLEHHAGSSVDDKSDNSSVAKSNIFYDRPHNWVDFALNLILDSAHIPHLNVAGGAAWLPNLPYCVSVKLRYSFGGIPYVHFLGMEGSHGGRACWLSIEDWKKCKRKIASTVVSCAGGDNSLGRLRLVADYMQTTIHTCLQGLRDGGGVSATSGGT